MIYLIMDTKVIDFVLYTQNYCKIWNSNAHYNIYIEKYALTYILASTYC